MHTIPSQTRIWAMPRLVLPLLALCMALAGPCPAQPAQAAAYVLTTYAPNGSQPGRFQLSVGTLRLVDYQYVFCWRKTPDGEDRMQADTMDTADDALHAQTRRADMVGKDGQAYATITQHITRLPNALRFTARATVLKNFTVSQSWRGFSEILMMPTSHLRHTTVETIRRQDGARFLALVPDDYSPQRWSLRSGGSRQIRLVNGTTAITVNAGDKTNLAFNHYGGRHIEFLISPFLKPYDLNLKPGQTFTWSYTMTFENL